MNDALVGVAIQEIPAVIDWLKSAFTKKHPEQPMPTDAEVMTAYEAAFQSSLAKDDAWLAAHPI